MQLGLIIMSLVLMTGATLNSSESVIDNVFVIWIIGLLLLVTPTVMVVVRRLHDLNRVGAWGLLLLVPWLNIVVFLYLILADSKPETNRWGPSPK